MTLNLFVIGSAGVGKTTFVEKFSRFLSEKGYSVENFNLDPGVKILPYAAKFDVRSWFTVEEIMKREKLGPNGALIDAMERLEERLTELTEIFSKTKPDFRLIDTPGQMEVFAFRSTGPLLVQRVKPSMAIFLMDGEFLNEISDFVVFYLLSLATELRLGVPTIKVLNRFDLVKVEGIELCLTDMEFLRKRLEEQQGVVADVSKDLVRLLEKVLPAARVPKVSLLTGKGLEEVFDLVYEAKCACGDLT